MNQMQPHTLLSQILKTQLSKHHKYKTIEKKTPPINYLHRPLLWSSAQWKIIYQMPSDLSVSDKIILMDDCLVIPNNSRTSKLRALHSAHQKVSSIKSRANAAVYWPGINNNIRNVQYTYHFCNEIAHPQTTTGTDYLNTNTTISNPTNMCRLLWNDRSSLPINCWKI